MSATVLVTLLISCATSGSGNGAPPPRQGAVWVAWPTDNPCRVARIGSPGLLRWKNDATGEGGMLDDSVTVVEIAKGYIALETDRVHPDGTRGLPIITDYSRPLPKGCKGDF